MTKGKVRIIVLILGGILLLGYLYRHSPRKIEFLGHYDKIGAHRVNTVEKLEQCLPYFDAIELDLVFSKSNQTLEVVHPTKSSTGLFIEEYSTALADNRPFLWLDLKNLEQSNAAIILDKLNSIFDSLEYPKDQILVETRYPDALPIFSEQGYKTSYYLPQQLNAKTSSELVEIIATIQRKLQQQPDLAISSSYEDYELMKTHFPEHPKYLWSLSHRKIRDYSLVRTFLKDATVKLVLVRYDPLF